MLCLLHALHARMGMYCIAEASTIWLCRGRGERGQVSGIYSKWVRARSRGSLPLRPFVLHKGDKYLRYVGLRPSTASVTIKFFARCTRRRIITFRSSQLRVSTGADDEMMSDGDAGIQDFGVFHAEKCVARAHRFKNLQTSASAEQRPSLSERLRLEVFPNPLGLSKPRE